MKKIIFAVYYSIVRNELLTNIHRPININPLGYYTVEFENNTSESLKMMTKEEKEWFKSTFVHRRGQFKIPDEPILDSFLNYHSTHLDSCNMTHFN